MMSIGKRISVMTAIALPLLAAAQAPPGIPTPKKISTPGEAGAMTLNAAPPGSRAEDWNEAGGSRTVRNVTTSNLLPFLPAGGGSNRPAVIVAPGGGYFMLSIDSEGYRVAQWLADHGIVAFVLKYRVTETPSDPAEFLANAVRNPGGSAPSRSRMSELKAYAPAVEDALAAVKLVRTRAGSWGIDSARIGFLGFSAGAISTLAVAQSSSGDSRPNFIGLIYGPMGSQEVMPGSPPMFAAMAADDPIFGAAGSGLVDAYRKAGLPVEFHLYEHGGHGFGMDKKGTTSDLWIDEFYAWMKGRGYVK